MRILLIAYEFPPSASPQSLRWAYLVRELAIAGHDVHVLTIDLGGSTPGLPALPDGVHIHRTHAGPVRGVVAWRRNRRDRLREDAPAEAVAAPAMTRSGWKQWASMRLQAAAERIWFPDLRGEWLRPARRALHGLLETVAPDVVVSSHEPATTLQLGLEARHRGFPWVADLGDPVLAHYTPPHWRAKAAALEADVCAHAAGILVTTASARDELEARHGRAHRVEVLTQGFDDRLPAEGRGTSGGGELELLYTGSFYDFRRPDALIEAVQRTPGIRLGIAAITAPDAVLRACRDAPDRFRMLGFLPHSEALRQQRRADVLVNIANRDASQVPGKVYEYLGACRPILHLRHDASDAVSGFVMEIGRGIACADDPDEIAGQLRRLRDAKRQGRLDADFDLSIEPVAGFGWSRIAPRLEGMLETAAGR